MEKKDELTAERIERQMIANLISEPELLRTVKNENITVDDFSDPLCRRCFEIALKYGEVTAETIMETMPEVSNKIIELMVNINPSPLISQWCDLLKEFTARRKIIEACNKMILKSKDRNTDIVSEIKLAVADILAQQNRLEVRHAKTIREIQAEYIDSLDPKKQNENIIRYGFPIDTFVSHRRGEILTIGAAPGTGKTMLALSAMLNMAREGRKAVLFCQEMQTSVLIQRLISNLAGCPFNELARPENRSKCKYAESMLFTMIEKNRITIRGSSEYSHSAIGIEAELQRIYNEAGGIDWFCVDYVQTLMPTAKAKDKREQLNDDLEAVKLLAMKFNSACLL